MQTEQLTNLQKAIAIVSDYTLYICKDRAFGDMEVYWSYPDPEDPEFLKDIASGYFGYDPKDKKTIADIYIRHNDLNCTFTGDEAHELLNHYTKKIISYNEVSVE